MKCKFGNPKPGEIWLVRINGYGGTDKMVECAVLNAYATKDSPDHLVFAELGSEWEISHVGVHAPVIEYAELYAQKEV